MAGQASENSNNINENFIAITFKLKLISRTLPFFKSIFIVEKFYSKKSYTKIKFKWISQSISIKNGKQSKRGLR